MAIRRALLILVVVFLSAVPRASAQETPSFATPGPCVEGKLPGGAKSLICIPERGWNGSLVVYAHGYVSPLAPLTFSDLTLADGTRIPDLIQQLGFAFATTTYRQNGMAILEGVADITELVKAFPVLSHGPPARTYLTGISEGALVATLAAEQHPDLFDAAYATCGPLGSLLFQINYVGDFRVLFDAYFPGVLPGSPVEIPALLQNNWDKVYAPAIRSALSRSPSRARELFGVARVPFDAKDAKGVADAAVGLLWYNVFGTNDARTKLGGNAYGNRLRWYSDSSNDMSLNLRVKRVDADVASLLKLRSLTPTGDLRIPLVTLHTTGDELVPYAHELLYATRARPSGRGRLVPVPVMRYGHCQLATSEVLAGFALMLGASQTSVPADVPMALNLTGQPSPLPVQAAAVE